ncbi:heme lyase CcmF/NrfE family subunit [Desulfitobacterium sp.]|uniref:heme lyase CcmF/NrfE family subunit n=1 Tax=Desulfitobacterium sp. TaxID=49981 RepID=UPI002C677210|nr:heme lyase CcmF/NrfE family subunit [Desulfitobacterium sp.]HVJ47690.1 heme lyase CcmF/NrfE family subunit [Desulfitobacterium sp.]
MAEAGYFSLVLALMLSLYGIIVFIIAARRDNPIFLASAKGASLGVAFFSSVATFILLYFLMTGDYSIKYVYEYTSNDLPLFYRFSAWWAGNAGSLLLWLFLLTWYTLIVAFSKKARNLTPYASAILLFNSAFFLFVLTFVTNPFEKVAGWFPGAVIPDGAGMNPLLQNPGMVFHPVTTYLGYVGFAVPFAYAMTALLTKTANDQWIKVTRHWTIVAWLFLTLGNLWGAQWAYTELGWGGYWGWDPVENASFIPWLTGSAFLHSVMIQERKNMLKTWNVVLITVTYVLTLFGTFLVRSGVLTSVHAFGDSALGKYFLIFTLIMLFFALDLIILRRDLLVQDGSFESFLSKESSFLINNLILVGLAVAVFFGTIYPLVSEAVRGVKVSVGASFFNPVVAPLGIALFLLMGICPLIAWRKASLKNLIDNFRWPLLTALLCAIFLFFFGVRKGYALVGYATATFTLSAIILEILRGTKIRHKLTDEGYPKSFLGLILRNRRRHGGYIIHIGVILMLLAIVGSHTANQDLIKTLKPGESVDIGNYHLTFNQLGEKSVGTSLDAVFADISVSDKAKGIDLGNVESQKVFYPTSDQPMTEIGLRSTLKEDLYIILSTWGQDGSATFKILINPLVSWLWIGGYVVILGAIFALWPGRGSQTGSKYLSTVNLPQPLEGGRER